MNWFLVPLAPSVAAMTLPQFLPSALAGFGLGLGLIVAIGAQNAFVLRQGIRRDQVLVVVAICIASDAVLIVAGVAGAGALFTAVPWLIELARWGGALFLVAYALLAARRAWRRPARDAHGLEVDSAIDDGSSEEGEGEARLGGEPAAASTSGATLAVVTTAQPRTTRRAEMSSTRIAVVSTALGLTWLNPHVYLDTFVLLGSIGSTHGEARWAFAVGAVTGSVVWFTALGLAARALAPVFARPNAWRILDAAIALVMTGIAAGLVTGG